MLGKCLNHPREPINLFQAAESVHINNSSIDAHIGGIHQKSTAQMIAANSFRISGKMDSPLYRLKLPDLADKGIMRVGLDRLKRGPRAPPLWEPRAEAFTR